MSDSFHRPDIPTTRPRGDPVPSIRRPPVIISERLFGRDAVAFGAGRAPILRPLPPGAILEREPPEPEGDDPISPPHLAAQVDFSPSACPTGSALFDIAEGIRRFLAGVSRAIDVRARCREGTNVLSVGVWLSHAPNPAERDARELSLSRLDLLAPATPSTSAETLGLFVGTGLIRRFADLAFASMPKRYDNYGQVDHDGPIHLTGIRSELAPPDRIVTRVDGFTDQTWPDTDFTLRITDTLSIGMRPVACGASTPTAGFLRCRSATEVDLRDAHVLRAIVAAILTVPIGVGFFTLAELIDAATSGGGGGGGSGGGGIGCQLADLAHTRISLPGRNPGSNQGSQIVPTYTRRSVTRGGLFLGGAWMLCLRRARLDIVGPRSFDVPIEDATVSAVYRADGLDTRGNLSVNWTVAPAGAAQILSPTSRTTRITFTGTDGQVVGTQPLVTRFRVTAAARDDDGTIPPTTLAVSARVSANPLPPEHHPGEGRSRHPL